MFVDQQDFFYLLDKDGTACSAHLECIAICAVEILLFQNAQNFTKVSHLTSLVVAQAHHAHDNINPYFTNKNTKFSLKASLIVSRRVPSLIAC